MATIIIPKRNVTNTTAPDSSDLQVGEIAINVMEESGSGATLYTKSSDGTIVNLTSPISSGQINTGTIKSIPFYASAGIVLSSSDDAGGNGMFWDAGTDRMGINTNAPASELHISGTGGIVIPVGTTAQRGTATQGKVRYNTSTSCFEGYDGSAWGNFATKLYVDTQITAQDVDATGDSGTVAIDLDSETLTIAGGTYLTSTGSGNTITIAHDNSGVTAGSYGSATAIPAITVDAQGHITSLSTNSISTNFTISDGSATDVVNTGETLTFTGGTGITTAVTDNEVTITRDALTLGTHTSGNYVSTVTAGTGLTSTGATSGEGIAHSLSVDASQTQITAVGTIGTGVWNGTAIADGYIASASTWNGKIDTAGTGLSKSSTTLNLANTAVTAGSYGSTTAIPVVTIDAQGRITSASTASISGYNCENNMDDTASFLCGGTGITIAHDDSNNCITITGHTAPTFGISNTNALCVGSGAGDGNWDNVTFLLQSNTTDGSTSIVDSSESSHSITVGGNTHHETDEKKWGTSSIAFDGTDDYLQMAESSDFDFGTSAFTIETWVYHNSSSGDNLKYIMSHGLASGSNAYGWVLARQSTNKLEFIVYENTNSPYWGFVTSNNMFSSDAWHHVAVSSDGSTVKLFVDGTERASSSSLTWGSGYPSFTFSDNGTATFNIGQRWDGAGDFNGYIEDVRITKGISRYSSNFTAPTATFSASGGQPTDNDYAKFTPTGIEGRSYAEVKSDLAIALGTDTSGSYVGTLTAGTGLTSTGNTTGEGITHSLSVDASQTQITAVGTIGTGTWQGTAIADDYISSASTWNGKIDTAGTGLSKSGTTLSVDAAQTQITSVGTLSSLTISGDLTVNGTTTTINSTTVSVDDKNIELGSVASPSDTTADGGGITLKGASDKTILWTNSTDAWHFNQGINVTSGNVGIGTTSPDSNLHVHNGSAGTVDAYANSTLVLEASTDNNFISMLSPDLKNQGILFGDATQNWNGQIQYNHNGNYMALYTNQSEQVRITSGGNVGIGTTTPQDKLSLIGDVGFINADNSTGDKGAIEWKTEHNYYDKVAWICGHRHAIASAPTSIRIGVGCVGGNGAGDVLTIGCNCNVGIGTTSPYEKLHVEGGALGISHSSSGYRVTHSQNSVNQYTIGNNTGQLRLDHDGICIINTGGKVGIGTATPVTKLDVFSGSGTKPNDPFEGQNQLFLSSGSTANAGLTIAADDGTNDIVSFFQSNQSADVGLIGTQSNHALRIRTNNSDRITILGGGNVGIGQTNPTAKFQINANQTGYTGVFYNSNAASEGVTIRAGNTSSQNSLSVQNYDGNTAILTARSDGNVGIGTGSPSANLHVRCATSGQNSTLLLTRGGATDYGIKFTAITGDGSVRIDSIGDHANPKMYFGMRESGTTVDAMTIDGAGNVGIGNTAPAVKLQVSGVICSSNCVKTPTVCSFNIGNDNTNTGSNAFVAGVCSQATGTCSSSFGTQTCATGNYSTAVGHNVCAIALDSNAFGLSTQACGSNSVAVGRSVITCNSKSSAFGYGSQARCDESLAMGFYAYGLGDRAIGIGYYSCADANYSVAVGYQTKTHAVNGSAYGRNSETCGPEATAVGNYTCATADDSSAFGYYAKATDIHTTAVGYCSCATEDHASAIGNRAQATAGWSIAVGYLSCTTGANGTSLGHQSCSQGSSNTAVGYCSSTNSDHTSAFGYKTCACGAQSSAFGYCSQARIGCTTNISTPLIHKKDSGETLGGDFAQFSSAESTLMTKEIDLKTTACHTITVPNGATFFINEAGVISTCVDTLTTQATFKIGCATDATNTILENTQTTDLTAAKKRERYIPNNSEDGLQTITVEISTGASATTAKGRFYFKGMLVEDE